MKSYILIFATKSSAEKVEKELLKIAKKRGNKCTSYSEVVSKDGKFEITVLNEDISRIKYPKSTIKKEKVAEAPIKED